VYYLGYYLWVWDNFKKIYFFNVRIVCLVILLCILLFLWLL
jgi:hypothetical protein